MHEVPADVPLIAAELTLFGLPTATQETAAQRRQREQRTETPSGLAAQRKSDRRAPARRTRHKSVRLPPIRSR